MLLLTIITWHRLVQANKACALSGSGPYACRGAATCARGRCRSFVAAELGRAQQELDRDLSMDRAQLRTWTHNLVTIRFALEQTHVLGRVMQELCCLLVEVLRVHWRLVQWHERLMHDDRRLRESSPSDSLPSFYKSLNELKPVVWNHCERVIVNCVDEYFSKRGELFGATDHGDLDDSLW
jgi:hypothetical protein